MSKYVASKSKDDQESRKCSPKLGGKGKEKQEEEGVLGLPQSAISTVVSPAPAAVDDVMHTPELKRLPQSESSPISTADSTVPAMMIIELPQTESSPISTTVSTVPATTIIVLSQSAASPPSSTVVSIAPVTTTVPATTTFPTTTTAPAPTNQFMYTPEFMRHFVEYVPGDTLMTLRLASKEWNGAADSFIDEGVESGELMVVDEKEAEWKGRDVKKVREERREPVTRVAFLYNITKIGGSSCSRAVNLVVVDIPEGVVSIGAYAFCECFSLTTVSFPTTLKYIKYQAFRDCVSLESADLFHTNLHSIGEGAFGECDALESMTIPESLQTFQDFVFCRCTKLVPSCLELEDYDDEEYFLGLHETSKVVAFLCSRQMISIKRWSLPDTAFFTDDHYFQELLLPFIPCDTLLTMMSVSKDWLSGADLFIDLESCDGKLMFHGGVDVEFDLDDTVAINSLQDKHELVTRVIFLPNIVKVGEFACMLAVNLVVLDIPEDVKRISKGAFAGCRSLTTVSFPTTLTSIGEASFSLCSSLEKVDLLHTNLQELGDGAFVGCEELKSMTIPDSLQTLGKHVFARCSKLVPSSIDVSPSGYNESTNDAVVSHLNPQLGILMQLHLQSFSDCDS